MAFVSNSNQQITLSDSMFNLTERERKFLEKSWAKTFADKIFPNINEDLFSVLYSNKASRPNTPVNVIVGALILKEVLGVTDDELVQALIPCNPNTDKRDCCCIIYMPANPGRLSSIFCSTASIIPFTNASSFSLDSK